MRAFFKLILLAGFVAMPSAAIGEPPAAEKKADKTSAKPIVVPFELLKSRHMAVQVKLNGKGPYRLIFDTGAPMNLINNRIAKDSGIISSKTTKPAFGLFGAMGQHVAKSLEIGDAKLEKVPTMVMDHPTVELISEALGPIDGIIGFPFFARYKMKVDYQKKELTLVPNEYVPGDYMEGLMAKVMSAQQDANAPKIVGPAALWGLTVVKEEDDDEAGVVVKNLLEGGAAAAAGLKSGDRILTIDGRWTDTEGDALVAASLVKPGRAVTVVVQRNGKEVKLTVKPVKGI